MADKKKEKPKAEEEDDEKPEGEEGAEGAAEAPAKKKLPLKLILIVVGVLVLIGAIVGGLFMTGIIGGKKKPAGDEAAVSADEHAGGDAAGAAAGKDKDAAAKEAKKTGDGKSVFYDLGEIMVNITGEGRRQTYLRLVVQLELESEADKVAIENLKPRIVDNFQTYLRELRLDDLRGSAGLYRLREELLFRVADAVHPIKVKDVLFQQMLVQ